MLYRQQARVSVYEIILHPLGPAQSGLLWTIVRLPAPRTGACETGMGKRVLGETQSMASVTHRGAEGKPRIVKY